MFRPRILFCLFIYVFLGEALFSAAQENSDSDPDVWRNISELISSKGYPVEEHEVLTGDGYILGIQRIPHGRKGRMVQNGRGRNRTQVSEEVENSVFAETDEPIVLLHHGIMATGADFIINFPDTSLGFLLSDSGYDVWITNARGNRYSRRHVSLSPKDPRFWQFSWDEMALVDLPSTIDYILNATGKNHIYYVGHSMGTSILFALLADRPEYNNKIKVGVALAPVAFLGHMQGLVKFFVRFIKPIQSFLSSLDHGELQFNNHLEKLIKEMLCSLNEDVCFNWFFETAGVSRKQFNRTRAPVYAANIFESTSVQSVVHFAQLIISNKFQKYDYGKEMNMKKYNQSTPPEYDVESITTPLALMWGLNDPTADPVDVALLAPRLKSLVLNYQVPDPEWSHVDFIIGLDAPKLVYQEVMKVLSEYNYH